MQTSSRPGRFLIYTLIFLSGISGLVYQVVWHKYLSILLGAQARATAVVLAIFLGGISAGYQVFGRWSRNKKWNLLFAYSLVELGLGVWAFVFPYLFRGMMPLVYKLYAAWGVESIAIDVLVSSLLLAFPTFLMGGTLPLLTQGLSEDLAAASGTHARIYGWNTVGACAGSLLAGYVLIPLTDLPVTVSLAGSLNVLVAIVSYFAFAKYTPVQKPAPMKKEERSRLSLRTALLFGVALCSGFYVLTMETVLIRLVGLSTGSSNYNFTLIVSIFVFGLGFGSLLARRIGDYSERQLFWNQLTVASSLFLLYLTADNWSYWAHLIRIVFRDTPQNFYVFQLALGVWFLLLLAVPVGFCGLTLPLCFHLLKDKKETLGYRVGQLYGLNTVGCVLGALVGGYALLYVLDLDQLFKLCVLVALISTSLAAYYCVLGGKPTQLQISLGTGVFTTVLVGTLIAPLLSKERFTQPFRQQAPIAQVSYEGAAAWGRYLGSATTYMFYKDGPNTSVAIGTTKTNGQEKSRTIFVNGKSDGNTRGDFFTMNMTGHFPGLFARKLDHVCVIGFGTGITTGALAKYRETNRIDVVDIADTILKSAHYFDAYNGDVSTNPRVHFNAMDAFRFLGGTKDSFDVIISEPSNPWVAGVENLYSGEFYEMAKEKLTKDGLFVQWVQAYSFNDDLLKMVLKTITNHFPYVSVFQMLEHDIALVASREPLTKADLQRAEARFESNPAARASLAEGGLTRLESVLALELVPAPLTRLLAEDAEEHRLEMPRLSHGAARSFFVSSSAHVHSLRRTMKEFYPAVDKSLLAIYLDGKAPTREMLEAMRGSFCESQHAKSKVLCEEAIVMGKWEYPIAPFETVYEGAASRQDLRDIASLRNPVTFTKSFTMNDFKETQGLFDLYKKFYSPIARFPVDPIVARIDSCLKLVPPTDDLHGDCLLQKAAVLEIARPEAPEFLATIRQFGEWFSRMSNQADSFRRFKKAQDILDRLVRDMHPAS